MRKIFLHILQTAACLMVMFSFFPATVIGADHVVDHSENMPCVLWCRGCSPTSATMVLGYWDRGDGGWEWYGMGRLTDYWRELSKYSDGTGPIINVPNVLDELRIDMGTNVNGVTNTGNIGSGIENTCNSRNGYDFDSSQTYCWGSIFGNDYCWGKITSEIDNNRPFVWSVGLDGVVGHSLAAWGYTDTKYVITYNTWQCPGRDDWYYRKYDNGSYYDWGYVDTVVPGGWTWGQTSLTWPDGGETLTAGKTYNVTWYEVDDRTWSADLWYSTNGGSTWSGIGVVEPSSPGWKTYAWTVPTVSTTKARVKIENWSGSSGSWVYQAGDGSEANFTIIRDLTAPTPNPMTWATAPYEQSTSEIRMYATTASDSFTPVEYYFNCYSSPTGGGGCTSSSWQTSTYYSDTGLGANHQYGYRVKARDGSPDHNQTGYSTVSYDYTDIETPSSITFGTITVNSIAVRSSNTPSGLDRGSSGLYLECYLNGNSAWKKNNDYWTQSGLSVNQQYYFRAKARNGDANETSYCSWANRYTLANTPSAMKLTDPTLTSIDVTIDANGNPSNTQCGIYKYDYGTDTGTYLNASGGDSASMVWQSISAWGTVTAVGLTPGTQYGFWAIAKNGNDVTTGWSPGAWATTASRTLTVTSPNGGEAWYLDESKNITWTSQYVTGNVKIEISRDGGSSWTTIASSVANDGSYAWTVAAPTSTACRVRITSLSYASVSDTSNANFTIADNTAPTPNPMTWAKEPYETSTSAISMVATSATDPTAPINYWFKFTDSPTGGTGGTSSAWITSTNYADTDLETNHQYGYQVYARDGSGNSTSAPAINYDFTDIESSTGITFGTITATSIQARSTNTPSGLTRGNSGLNIYNDTNSTSSGWKQNNDLWTSGGLTPNTSYSFRALSRNGDANASSWSPTSAKYTLAALPDAAAFTSITQESIQANWTANGNPAGTEYYCENTTAGTNSGWITDTAWNSTGLNCNTSYDFRVKARNSDLVETAWVSLGSRSTLECGGTVSVLPFIQLLLLN